MNQQKQKKLKLVLKELSKLSFVDAVFLFGSYVNGKSRGDSDIDLAVLTKKVSRGKEIIIHSYGGEEIDISIFNRLPLIIQFRVLKEGKIVFCKDKKAVHAAKVAVFKQYWDFADLNNRFYRTTIKNV